MKFIFTYFVGFLLLTQVSFAQYSAPTSLNQDFHPTRIFSVEISSTIGIGQAQGTLMFFNNQYSIWQRPKQFLNIQTGIGAGFMSNDFGKLLTFGAPLGLVYVLGGQRGHYFEMNIGTRFLVGFSLAEGFQVVPLFTPSIGYRYQIPGEVFFHVFSAIQYHSNLGVVPFVGIGVGYDY